MMFRRDLYRHFYAINFMRSFSHVVEHLRFFTFTIMTFSVTRLFALARGKNATNDTSEKRRQSNRLAQERVEERVEHAVRHRC